MKTNKIFVVKLGWVLIGVEQSSINGIVTITDASVIRRWGTERGLGQLALVGPTKDTLLDPVGEVEISEHAVLMRIRCAK